MRLIRRNDYLDRLIACIGSPDIKVITGVRRSGKSKLLEAFRDHVESTLPDSNVIQINYNLIENENLAEYHALVDYVERFHIDGKHNFVLIDEVQMCEGFEKAINSLHASEGYDIYITGSNAFLLSSDLATLFTGRTIEIEVFPFSLAEFMRYYDLDDEDSAFDRYVVEGGMPGSYVYPTQEMRYRYVSDVCGMLVMRDIRQKYRIRSTDMLERLTDFMMDNVSNISSIRSITDALSANGIKASGMTVASYMEYLCNAFAFYRVRRYDLRGKRYLASGDKYYLCDQSFRFARLGTRNLDYGRVYENIVAIELMRRGYEVYVGTLYKREVDFVAMRQGELVYIQVSDDISNRDTFERECAPLLAIRDAYPKMVIARTRHEAYDHEGIRVVDIARWLCGAEKSTAR
ncbi:MAG: ATP-binding protein [Atopobiaceae bacterium]|jgi:predicted AAA+ superfamily ATPase|nr:ATP-binding protein [Atopobiaceae bacterium]